MLVLESSPRVGGAVRTLRRDGFLLEMGPNTVRPNSELWSLVEDLGVSGSVLLADPRTPRYIDFDGSLHALPLSPIAFAKTRLLSLSGKLRLLGEPFVPRANVEEETVRSFFSRRLGPQVEERFLEPFVSGVWAGDSGRLEIVSAFPTLARYERDGGSIVRGAIAARLGRRAVRGPRPPRGLLSFRGGLEELPRALAAGLGARIRLSTPVVSLSRSGGSWTVHTSGGDMPTERVVLAASADEAARIVREVSPEAARALGEIPHPPLAVLHLSWPREAFPRPLRGFGHLVVPSGGRRILGAVWSSSLFAGRAPEGQALLTVFVGGARDPEAIQLPDSDLVEAAAHDIATVLGVTGRPRAVSITRYTRALPQYELGHSRRMRVLAEAETRLSGLTFLGNYRGGVSVGDVVAQGLAVS